MIRYLVDGVEVPFSAFPFVFDIQDGTTSIHYDTVNQSLESRSVKVPKNTKATATYTTYIPRKLIGEQND